MLIKLSLAFGRCYLKILLIEDSVRLQRSIKQGLSSEGYAVDIAGDGREGLALMEAYGYDLVILDLMLPQMDGLSVLRQMRSSGKTTHVLILSARVSAAERIQGLEVGADDYLIKPFVFQELVARIRALLRRQYAQKDPVIALGPFQVNTAKHRVSLDKTPLELTPKEYAILEYLLMQRGTVVSRDRLIAHLYEGYGNVASNVIDVVICTLRKKLQLPDQAPLIETKRGFGYVID